MKTFPFLSLWLFLSLTSSSFAAGSEAFKSIYETLMKSTRALTNQCSSAPYSEIAQCIDQLEESKHKFYIELAHEKQATSLLEKERLNSKKKNKQEIYSKALEINRTNIKLISDCIQITEEELKRLRIKIKEMKAPGLEIEDIEITQ